MALPASTADQQRREVVSKAGVNVWLMLYQAERKHLVEVCETALRLGSRSAASNSQNVRGPGSPRSSES
jgi:hypothetical protein